MLPVYDAMGNIHAMTDSFTGNVLDVYEYDAFGNTLMQSGTYAAYNPFRFSTKYTDDETSLIYYGRRFYSPSQGRFIGKDPLEEKGGIHLYAFCCNNAVNSWDFPSQWKQKTLSEIFEAASKGEKSAQTAKKILTDGRFKK